MIPNEVLMVTKPAIVVKRNPTEDRALDDYAARKKVEKRHKTPIDLITLQGLVTFNQPVV